jgi:predicted  nucleic acid-binding Zn-ribbon protein
VTTGATAQSELLALQDLDTSLDQLRHHRANLPERRVRSAAATTRDALRRALTDIGTRRTTIATAAAGLERSIRDLDARAADLAAKLPRTMVVREAEALMAEQRTTQQRRSEVEDEELALLEEDEGLDAQQTAREADLAEAEASLEVADGDLRAAEAQLDEQMGELEGRRADLAATLPAELVAQYDHLRARFDGVAIARLEGARCSGCHLTLSTAAVERIRSAPPEEWVECEECGRLLVR